RNGCSDTPVLCGSRCSTQRENIRQRHYQPRAKSLLGSRIGCCRLVYAKCGLFRTAGGWKRKQDQLRHSPVSLFSESTPTGAALTTPCLATTTPAMPLSASNASCSSAFF